MISLVFSSVVERDTSTNKNNNELVSCLNIKCDDDFHVEYREMQRNRRRSFNITWMVEGLDGGGGQVVSIGRWTIPVLMSSRYWMCKEKGEHKISVLCKCPREKEMEEEEEDESLFHSIPINAFIAA